MTDPTTVSICTAPTHEAARNVASYISDHGFNASVNGNTVSVSRADERRAQRLLDVLALVMEGENN